MTEAGMRKLIEAHTIRAGGVRSGARNLGLSAAYLSDIIAGKRGVSMRVAGKLGYRREEHCTVKYVKVRG